MWVQFAHFKKKKSLYFKVFGTLTDKVRKKFDYLEAMPVFSREVVETIIELGEKLDIPVCAVSDARFLRREDEVLLRELNNTKIEAPRYLRDYHGKCSLFSYLSKNIQDRIIIGGPQRVLGMIEDVQWEHVLSLN